MFSPFAKRDPEALDFYRIVTAPSWISEPGIEILDLRHFSTAVLRPLLEEETQAWARVLAWDYRNSADMVLRYVDAKILPGYVAIQRGRPVGYCFFVYEGSKGVFGDLYVSQAWASDRTIEYRLLAHSLATLQRSPGVRRVESQLLLHETGTVAQPFLQERFRQYPRLFMAQPVSPAATGPAAVSSLAEIAEIVVPADIEVRRWAEQDYQPAAGVITASYQDHVDAEINDQYCTNAGSLRFLNNIVRFPGCGVFDNGASFVALHRATRTMIGIILCSRVREDIGHVTQVCVVPDQRGRGLGKLLLGMTFAELQRRHFSSLTLTVTEANSHAVELYHHLGYVRKRLFDAFVWER